MGRAKNDHSFRACHLSIIGVEIVFIPTVVVHQLAFDHVATSGPNDAGKGVVNWGKEDNAVTHIGERVNTKRCAVDQTMRGKNRFRIHAPSMAVFHPPTNRISIGSVVSEISHDTMVCLIVDRFAYAIGRGKVHIRDPHCEAIIGRNAVDGLHLVPLDVMGAATVDDFVEIH